MDFRNIFNTVIYISSYRDADMALNYFSLALNKPKDKFYCRPLIGFYYGFICTNEGNWDSWDVYKAYPHTIVYELDPDIEDGFSVYKIE